jgi:hypothetical protein
MVPEPVFRIPGVLILIWDPLFCFEATPDPCQSVVYKIALVTEMHVCYGEAKHTFFYIFGSAPGILESGSLNTEALNYTKAWMQKHKRKSLNERNQTVLINLKIIFYFCIDPSSRGFFYKTMHKIIYIFLLLH